MDSWSVIPSAEEEGQNNGNTNNTPPQRALSPVQFLIATGGLDEAEALRVVDVAGAKTTQDFALFDVDMLSEITRAASLKPVPAKKLSNAVQALKAATNKSQEEEKSSNKNTEKEKGDEGTEDAAKKNDNKDAPAPTDLIPPAPSVQECVVIAIDRSGSMGAGLNEARAFGPNAEKTLQQRSRMDAVKQCFYAFRDRTETLPDAVHKLALIQFDNFVEQLLPLTADLDRFEAVVDDMRPRGATSIYSAILQACHVLEEEQAQNKAIDLRVLVLTDGQNNSGVGPNEAWQAVRALGVVVDAILVGDAPDTNLRKIVAASGGACFQISSLAEGFELMEAESVVSLKSRRGGADKKSVAQAEVVDFEGVAMQTITQANQAFKVSTAPAKTNNEPESLVPCNTVVQANPNVRGGTMKRIMKELQEFAGSPTTMEGIHLFVDENNLYQMKALLEGPPNTAYEGGVFVLNITLPSDYPFKPPKVYFETPVFHCNVNSNGGMCLDILKDQWSPSQTIPECLRIVRNDLMVNPNTDDALRPAIAELYFAFRQSGGTDTRFWDQAQAATHKDASKTVKEWKEFWAHAAAAKSKKNNGSVVAVA